MAAGRFAPARFIEEEKGLIDFGADYSPRFSAVYDLFGDGRTALKTSWSKYYRNYDGDIAANAYGRAGERSEMRTWLDRNLVAGTNNPSGAAGTCPGIRVLPTDCDGVAQDNEIGISPSGGAFANPDRPDRKPLNLAASVQRRVHGGRAASGDAAAGSRRDVLQAQDRGHGVPGSDEHHARRLHAIRNAHAATSRETRMSRRSLKAGEMVPVYNLDPAKLARLQRRRRRSQRYDQRHAVHRIRGVVQHQASGRRDAVRQLDGRAHTAAVVRQRRQPERADDDRAVQPDCCHDGQWTRRWAAASAIRRSSTTRSCTSSSSRETTRSRTASTSAR